MEGNHITKLFQIGYCCFDKGYTKHIPNEGLTRRLVNALFGMDSGDDVTSSGSVELQSRIARSSFADSNCLPYWPEEQHKINKTKRSRFRVVLFTCRFCRQKKGLTFSYEYKRN